VPGANNPRRVFSTTPIEIDLARSPERFQCFQLQEPDLIFGGAHRCVDPRTGLAAFGHFDAAGPDQPGQVRVGIVGTPEAIENSVKFLDEISHPVEQDANVDCVLHPSFPGMNSQEPFRVHLLTQTQWHRPLRKRDFHSLLRCSDFTKKWWLLQEIFGGEVRAVSELEHPPQVVLCALSEPMMRLMETETANKDALRASQDELLRGEGEGTPYGSRRKFQGGLRAECMGSLPIEMIWDQLYTKTNGMRDRATWAWNLSLGLLHKSGLIPWRLANASETSCYVGISFYRTSPSSSIHTLKGFAHVVTEMGDAFVVDGDSMEWNSSKQGDMDPHLDEEQAKSLLSRALGVFKKKAGSSPRKVAVHKTTPYSEMERRGFECALQNVPQRGLLTISQRGIFCVRPGRKPILRGTAIPFDENLGLVFTSGYVPFLRAHLGSKLPQSLEITENWGSLSFSQVAQDLIRLTKLDLNSSRFCSDYPATLAHRQEIGDVLQALGRKGPSLDEKYYL
jgi:hypothetical protein